MPDPAFTLTLDQRKLQAFARQMKREGNGKELRRDFVRNIKAALEPAVADAKSSIMQMDSAGLAHEGEPLRRAIARRLAVKVKLSGRSTGAAVRAGRRGMPRGFEHAPKRTNRQHWRHRVYGADVWVTQTGEPRWFDDAMKRRRDECRAAVKKAMADMARRLTHRGI